LQLSIRQGADDGVSEWRLAMEIHDARGIREFYGENSNHQVSNFGSNISIIGPESGSLEYIFTTA
jgi:hypothetical protein